MGIPIIILKYAEKFGLNAIFLLEKLILVISSVYKRIMEGRKRRREVGGRRREMLIKLKEEGRRREEGRWREDAVGGRRQEEDGRKEEEDRKKKGEKRIRDEEGARNEESNMNKLDLVLDLDETLIYCSSRVRREGGNVIRLEGKEYQILVRPKCEQFLEKVFFY